MAHKTQKLVASPLKKRTQRADYSNNVEYCFHILKKVSRSFAVVIQQLTDELRTPICVFYLVLRALDTVEDDMTITDDRKKKELLRTFHTRLTNANVDTCTAGIDGYGDTDDYRDLVRNFDKVVRVLHTIPKNMQTVVVNTTRDMGKGMASFVGNTSITTKAQYDKYCYYVAGLVGIGLSNMFACGTGEGSHMKTKRMHGLSIHMGLFLQKTNIIRDYLEDVNEGRPWWPSEVWKQYANSITVLKESAHESNAVSCLNELICDALQHAPHCLTYLEKLNDPTVLKFCAVPQVMAIATLHEMLNNANVFRGVVKISKITAMQLLIQATTLEEVRRIFHDYASKMLSAVRESDPSARKTKAALGRIIRKAMPTTAKKAC